MKKLVSILATSIPVTVARKKVVENTEDSKNLGTTIKVGENSNNLRSNFAKVLYI